MTSRAKTPEEIRADFLDTIREYVRYWAELPDKSTPDCLNGLAFSILSIFDGTAVGLPAFDILAHPHPNDKAYDQANDEDWVEPGTVINDCYLHELYYEKKD